MVNLEMLACQALALVILVSSGNHLSAAGFSPYAISTQGPVKSRYSDSFHWLPFHHVAATTSNDTPDPTKDWFFDTKPIDVIRYFAKEEVTDDEIEKILDALQITTLKDLSNELGQMVPLVREDEAFTQFCGVVTSSCDRFKDTAEAFLGGSVVYDKKTILDDVYDTYSEDAVSVTPTDVGSRDYRFSLVSGPSGSGKTMFALRRLPLKIFPGDKMAIFVLQFQTIMAFALASTTGVTFPDAVASQVQDMITAKLSERGLTNVIDIDLSLNVVIDEAGGEGYKKLFASATSIFGIVAAIETKVTFKFKKGVHVTVVGTGLELSTLEIGTTTETTKFRMLPWTVKNFDDMVEKSSYDGKTKAKQIARDFPILGSMVVNARCAYLLLKMMPDPVFLERDWIKSSLNGIISEVCYYYVKSNGLNKLSTPQEKWALARSIFREINKATSNPDLAFFPQFEDLTERLRSIALSMVDVQAVAESAKPVLRDSRYSVSMAPALFIVLSILLNGNSPFSWDWEGFESTVALGEWKYMVATSKGSPTAVGKSIVQMPYPVPATGAKSSLIVPRVNKFTVVINGAKAPYADVIAPYRLAQAKFSVYASKDQSLDLQTELDKMGLTNSVNYTIQQALTTVIYENWKSEEILPPATVVLSDQWSAFEQDRSEYYPSDKLVVQFPVEVPSVYTCQLEKGVVMIESRKIKALKAFVASRPVVAVFVTNSKAFVVPKRVADDLTSGEGPSIGKLSKEDKNANSVPGKKESVRIEAKDVDLHGKLKEEIITTDVVAGLRKNVELRFIFV